MALLRGPQCHKETENKAQQNNKISLFIKEASPCSPREPRWLGSAPWPLTLNSGMPMEITRKGVLSCSEGAFRFPCVLTILPWGWPSGLKVMAGNRISWWQSSHCRFPVGCWNCSTINESWDMTGRWSYWVLPWEITGLLTLIKSTRWGAYYCSSLHKQLLEFKTERYQEGLVLKSPMFQAASSSN